MKKGKVFAFETRKFWDILLAIVIIVFLTNAKVFAGSNVKDYWKSTESFNYMYTGYIQFVPSAETTYKYRGNREAGLHVKQAYIDYEINHKSITGGKKYTAVAESIKSDKIYSQTIKAYDTLNPIASKTTFVKGWSLWFD